MGFAGGSAVARETGFSCPGYGRDLSGDRVHPADAVGPRIGDIDVAVGVGGSAQWETQGQVGCGDILAFPVAAASDGDKGTPALGERRVSQHEQDTKDEQRSVVFSNEVHIPESCESALGRPPGSTPFEEVPSLYEGFDLSVGNVALQHPEAAIGMDACDSIRPEAAGRGFDVGCDFVRRLNDV